MRTIKLFIPFLIMFGGYLINPLFSFAAGLQILDYHYDTHFSPGEKVTFSATIKNNGATQNAYLYVVLTNSSTGVSTDPAAVTSASSITAGTTKTYATRSDVVGGYWVAVPGIYNVSISIYGPGDVLNNRVYGSQPVHVGTTTDSVAAFPRVLDFGAIQYGRYMHPVPVEISWDFFSYSSQIRKDHPWYLRIYTDNHKRYKGVDSAIYSGRIASQEGGGASALGSPAGLVSEDGKFTLPLKTWCLNYGPDVEEGWDATLLGPPPVQEDYYWKGPLLDTGKRDASRMAWEWIPDYLDMSTDSGTWRNLIGQDPYNTHYVSDSNPTGDFTLTSPFQIFLAYEASPTTVAGKYTTDLILEIYSP